MFNKFFKAITIASILTLLFISTSSTTFAAATKTASGVTTDRTDQILKTGVITCDPVTIPHYAKTTTLSGKVVIDGPKLILKVNDVDVTDKANIIKVADKTWTYSYTYSFSNLVGDISINLEARTVYINGQPAGNTHTMAAPVVQTIHVPFVSKFEHTNLTWDSYNRDTNIFGLSYKLVKVWDDGTRETASQKTAGTVNGTSSYSMTAVDPTHNNGSIDDFCTVTPPVLFRNFTFPEADSDYRWGYNNANKTYSVTFNITKLWSDGSTTFEPKTVDGLVPGSTQTVALAIDGITNSKSVTVPTIPEVKIAKTYAEVIKIESLANNGNDNNNNDNKDNNYKVTCRVFIEMNDGTKYTFDKCEVTFPYNNGQTSSTRDFPKSFTINGIEYDVTFSLTISLV